MAADVRKPLKFTTVDPGKPLVLEVKKGGKRFRIRIALNVGELFDMDMTNPFTKEPVFEFRASLATDVKPAAATKSRGAK
jgi:hypothetical protein